MKKNLPQILISLGCLLLFASLILFIFIFAPVAKVELNYTLSNKKLTNIKPIDKEFSIVIPKINANSRIIANVDPYNPGIYQVALTKGVAQAKGTAMPDQIGNMFLFSHSSANLLEASRYNSIFFLLSKLEKNDEIDIYYKNAKYKYKVTDKKIVNANDVSYLDPRTKNKQLTLMTCWPAGTTYKRLLVIAEAKTD